MPSDARLAIRRAFRAGPDPYAELDAALATRLGGALWLVGALYALIVLPLAPPERGALGWVGVAACFALAVGAGVWLLRRRRPLTPDVLLAIAYAGIFVATVFRWFAGSGSPFPQLLFLACLYAAAIHPARRALGVLAAATLAALSPLAYAPAEPGFAPRTLGHLALTWSLALILLVWTTRMRSMRREVAAGREQAERLARIDPLTGLANKRALEEALPVEIARARRDGRPLSVLFADLDGFKAVNDGFGHPAGDDLLRAVARALTSAVRVPDPCFRWGGDEFVALLPGADMEAATEVAKRVSSTVALSCRRPDGRPQRISTGVAELQPHETGEDLVARADAELLAAKARRPQSARAS